MTDFSSEKETPIRNLQNMLRLISQHYNTIPLIIPDGIYGKSTTDAITSFQEAYSLPVTGEVDFYTFNEIVRIYKLAQDERMPHRKTMLITNPSYIIFPGDSSPHISVIKSMVKNISDNFENLNKVDEINNVYDDGFVEIIKQIQLLADIDPNGEINKNTFNIISYLYEIFVQI